MALAWAIVGITVAALLVAALRPILNPPSLAERAKHHLQLPAGAVVTKVVDRDGVDLGDVWFTVPEPTGKGSRLVEIWTLNYLPAPYTAAAIPATKLPAAKVPTSKASAIRPRGTPGPVRAGTTAAPGVPGSAYLGTSASRHGMELSVDEGGISKELTYDPKTGQYHFRAFVTR